MTLPGLPNLEQIRADFPILQREVQGQPLVYLDNAASSQKPRQVIDAITHYYYNEHSNVHRGVHFLSQLATDKYEGARERIRQYMNALHTREIIYTSGTTGAINLAAYSFGNHAVKAGDEVVVSTMEHHSNLVPWQMLCQRVGATLRVAPITDEGDIIVPEFEALLNERTRLVALPHVSNALGTVNPVKELIAIAHRHDIPVLLDGAQAAPHLPIDVRDLDCDFYALSSHKMFGPTGIGILYAKERWLDAMPPYQGGGEMIKTVTFEETTYNELPHKFEAGTPNVAGAIGLAAAIDYVEAIGHDAIQTYEQELLRYATERLEALGRIRIIGQAAQKVGVISFLQEGIHPYDTGTILDKMGIAVRTGHHCTEPLMNRLEVPGTVRASFAFYNTVEEVDRLAAGLEKVRQLFG
ncbi:MAG: cysteine desulfurase [Bacteroidota bacterium]